MLPREVTDTEIRAFDLEFERDVSTFYEHLPEMLKDYPGEFVAIYRGEIIGHQKDWESLAKSVQDLYPNQFVFLKKVISESPDVIFMDTAEA